MPQLDPTTFATQIFWLVITFGALYAILSRVALPRVADILAMRRKKIDGDLDAAATLKSEAESVLKAYEKAMADARAQAQATLRQAAEDLAADAATKNAALSERLNREIKAAEERIAAAKNRAVDQISEIAGAAAGQATARLIGRAPDANAVRAAVEAAIKSGRG